MLAEAIVEFIIYWSFEGACLVSSFLFKVGPDFLFSMNIPGFYIFLAFLSPLD